MADRTKRPNRKGRNDNPRDAFTRLPHVIQSSGAYSALNPNARALLLEILSMHNGNNNGSLWLSVRDATHRMGLASVDSARTAFEDLMTVGFVRMLYADGWQPYSVKIGDRYYSYKRLDPFALTIGAAADIATLSNGMTDNQRSKGAALVVASIMGNLSNKTWLSGLADVLAAADDPERFGDSFIKRFAGSLAVPTGVAQIARTVDPTLRETPDTTTYIQSRVPGLSGKLLPKRDVWGRPIETEGGIGPDIISPIWTSTAKADPATWEALRVDATISPPSDRVNGKKLDPNVYDRLQAVTGPLAHKWVSELIAKPEYRSLDMDGQAKAIKFVMEKAREAAKANVLGGVPIPANRPERGQRKPSSRRAPPALPPGFQIEPLPTGFVLDR
ncbi:hypothetical protein [Sphingopyxis sp.]|jgi:hypothetical protein|uniref:hypothetical protein n=1 Tax=Sphingopyxis sp. TaxID=1908224 RepID=UPI00311F60ED